MHAAPSPAGTLTCYNNGTAGLTINLTSFFFDTFSSEYFTVYTDATNFDDLTYQRFFTSTFDYCQFSTSTRTFPSTITEEGVAVNVGMGGNYTQVTFSYENRHWHPRRDENASARAANSRGKGQVTCRFPG